MRSVIRLAIVLLVAIAPVAAQDLRFAVVSHNNVPVMAGPRKPDAQLMKVMSGEIVEYLGESGEFGKVRLAGGTLGYIARGTAKRPYVELDGSGEAKVLVDRLKIRPHANLDWPPMGTLEPGTRVIVLEEVDAGWLQILAPRDQVVYIHRDYLRLGDDQANLATTFANSDRTRRTKMLASGKVSSELVARIDGQERLDQRLAAAEKAMAEYGRSEGVTPRLRELEAEYAAIATEAPEGSLARATAGERLAFLRDRREAADAFDQARRRIAEIENDQSRRDVDYQGKLQNFRDAKLKEMAEPKARDSRFLPYGIGELHRIFITETQRPTWVLSKGLEERYIVTSERYDLSEYHGKTIGITGWEKLGTPKEKDLQRIEITRLEVLN